MKVRKGLVFKKDGSLVGFRDLADINNSIKALECRLNNDKEEVATHYVDSNGMWNLHRFEFSIGKFSNKR